MAARTQKSCSKGHGFPEVELILSKFGLQDEQVLNVYVVGSHVWGTCHKHSDFDLVVVTRTSKGKPLNNHRGNLEAFILSLEDYSAFISQHSMQVLITLWLPNDFVLRQKYDPKKAFSFDKQALVKSLEHTRERDLRVAEKHFIKHNTSASKKVLIHFLRYLELAVQISKEGKITCYTSANDCRNTILENYSSEWKELLTEVQPLMVSLWGALVQ